MQKSYPEHMKAGSELANMLKTLWTKEQQQELARKLAEEILDNKDDLAGYIRKNHLIFHKNLSLSGSITPAKYPLKGLTPDMVERIMTAVKGELHMEYAQDGIFLFEILKDIPQDTGTENLKKQREVFAP